MSAGVVIVIAFAAFLPLVLTVELLDRRNACTDDMLPVLCSVPVATSGEYLVAQATDRFTAAFKRVKLAKRPPARFHVQLQVADAKRLLNLFRPDRTTDPEISIESTGPGKIHVSSRSAGFALGFTGLDLELIDGDRFASLEHQVFPNLTPLLPSPEDLSTPVSVGSFALKHMAKFKAAIDAEYGSDARYEGVAIQLCGAPNKPMGRRMHWTEPVLIGAVDAR